jgi:hypothetical protein
VAAAGGLFLAIFLLYFLVYRVRHFALPLGWDTPWYVWRADFVASEGLGALDTASRPGHALLSAVLMSITGLSALELQVVLPYVLVGAFALAIGAIVSEGLGADGPRWAVAAGTAGALVGATRLVGENVANVLHLGPVVGGMVLLLRFASRGRGFAGSVLLLCAAGLTHWLFLAVAGAVLAVWFVLALPRSRGQLAADVPPWRSESGAVAAVGGTTGVAMVALIYGVLGTTFSTFEIREAKRRFIPKLGEDLSTLRWWAVAPVAALGGGALVAEATRGTSLDQTSERAAARRATLRFLAAWTLVSGAGIAYSAITLDLPPHRFLTLLVAVPGIVAVGAAVHAAARWIGRRTARVVGLAVATAAVALLAVPGALVWYGPADLVNGQVVSAPAEGPEQWFDATAFREARAASEYVSTLPPDRPVVFLVGPTGASGPISVPLKERTIRAALPAERQLSAHFFPGRPEDLLVGQRTTVGNGEVDVANLPYWQDVAEVLPSRPPVLVLSSLGPREFRQSVMIFGATEIFPGVALLRGPPPQSPLPDPEPLSPVPTTEAGVVRALVLIVLLSVAGAGWTLWFLGPGASPLTAVSLSPVVGAGMVMLGALAGDEAGLRLGASGGLAVYSAVTVAGLLLAFFTFRRRMP